MCIVVALSSANEIYREHHNDKWYNSCIFAYCILTIFLSFSHTLKKCITFKFSEGDKFDIVFVPIPVEKDTHSKLYYSEYYSQYEDYGDKRVPAEVTPEQVKSLEKFDRYGEKVKNSRMSIQVDRKGGHRRTESASSLFYHRPVIKRDLDFSEGDVCVFNRSGETLRLLYAIIPSNDEWEWVYEDEEEEDDNLEEEREKLTKKVVQKNAHIYPLQQKIRKLKVSAQKCIGQLKHVDSMEQRMRKTSESTNSRVKVLSLASISVLLLTTFIQTRYLKSFFKKKKVI